MGEVLKESSAVTGTGIIKQNGTKLCVVTDGF